MIIDRQTNKVDWEWLVEKWKFLHGQGHMRDHKPYEDCCMGCAYASDVFYEEVGIHVDPRIGLTEPNEFYVVDNDRFMRAKLSR